MTTSKRVLNVGQCGPDHSSIEWFLQKHFDVEVVRTHYEEDTLSQLQNSGFDLVLINRKLDADYSDGLSILKKIKDDPASADVTVMLVSNYADAHESAVKAGGEYGFGKAELGAAEVVERLKPFLDGH